MQSITDDGQSTTRMAGRIVASKRNAGLGNFLTREGGAMDKSHKNDRCYIHVRVHVHVLVHVHTCEDKFEHLFDIDAIVSIYVTPVQSRTQLLIAIIYQSTRVCLSALDDVKRRHPGLKRLISVQALNEPVLRNKRLVTSQKVHSPSTSDSIARRRPFIAS